MTSLSTGSGSQIDVKLDLLELFLSSEARPVASTRCARVPSMQSHEGVCRIPRNPTCKFGRGQQCIECTKAVANARLAMIGKRKKRVLRPGRWHQLNPKARHCHHTVEQALKKGTLIKQPCEHCGRHDRVEAHHESYDHPLAIEWACRPCHRRIHRLAIAAGKSPSLSDTAIRLGAAVLPKAEPVKIPAGWSRMLHLDERAAA